MIWPIKSKMIFRGQIFATSVRVLSAQPARAPATDSKFQEDWNNAKSFESMPSLTRLEMFRSFLPGGILNNFM